MNKEPNIGPYGGQPPANESLPDCDKDGNPNLYSSQDVINQLMTCGAEDWKRITSLELTLRSALVDMSRVQHVGYEPGMLDDAIAAARNALR
jgi:hypothetical protein